MYGPFLLPLVLFALALIQADSTASVALGVAAVVTFGWADKAVRDDAAAERKRAASLAEHERSEAFRRREAERVEHEQGDAARIETERATAAVWEREAAAARIAASDATLMPGPEMSDEEALAAIDAAAVSPGGCAVHHVCTPGAYDWRCPTHDRAESLVTPSGRNYIGCPECRAVFDPSRMAQPTADANRAPR